MSHSQGLPRDIVPAEFRVAKNKVFDFALKRLLGSDSAIAMKARSLIWREEHLASGTVSVIVPFFNVESYLGATLESIRLQRYRDFQVILVDDGSTDHSRTIAAKFVAMDPRFELHTSPNAGPGGARNRGLERASGRFISFVDGDDVLPYGALYRQVQALQESEVGFCVGAFERLDKTRRWRLPWVTNQHSAHRPAVMIDEVPGITRNVFPWNKLFTREFFDNFVGPFPEGTIYEDQVPTARAYTSGVPFTVLSETVYHWRVRGAQDSITQNRSALAHLKTRVDVLEEVEAIYRGSSSVVYREWLKKSIFEDMRPFFAATEHSNAEFEELLQRTCWWLWGKLSEAERSEAAAPDRARTAAALRGDFVEARTIE